MVSMALISDNLTPFFWIFVALGHYHTDLIRPTWAEFKDAPVDLHSNRTRIGNYHGFSGQEIFAVVLVMIENIVHKGIDCVLISENSLHLTELTLATLNYRRISIVRHNLIFGINQF